MKAYIAPILSAALEKFGEIAAGHSEKRLVVFCEDRLSLVAERALCQAVGGTFTVSVYTLSRFLAAETGGCDDILTSQGSAMALRAIIEAKREELQLFKRLSAAGAAQDVYDTIALLYSSKVKPEDIEDINSPDNLLKRKLHDLALLYREYAAYLETSGATDRNVYLRRLPEVIRASSKIKGADVLFFGFQAFTSSVEECVRACAQTADDVFGLFIGGSERKYVNEGWTTFAAIAKEFGKNRDEGVCERLPSNLCAEAEHLRKWLFEPEGFHRAQSMSIPAGTVTVAEAADEEEEMTFVAAQILKCVQAGGVRYREISVMLPDLNKYQPIAERVFGEYGIPMYTDRRYPLSSNFLCPFILDYLTCAIDGCRPESVAAVVSSPIFVAEGKDEFLNYLIRNRGSRGVIRKPVNAEFCTAQGFDANKVEKVRSVFCEGLKYFSSKQTESAKICASVRALLTFFDAEGTLAKMAKDAEGCGYPSVAEMSARAYQEVLKVVAEAEKLTVGVKLTLREFSKLLKSGFTAAEISLIQPKQDAVFVCDVSSCVNAGSKISFVAGLTEGVPLASQDTAILTDGELVSLEKLKVAVSPKISQVNRRVKEVTALNVCSFSQKLYLSYPVRCGGEESVASEIIAYVGRLFNVGGNPVKPLSVKHIAAPSADFIYFNCRPAPALRSVAFYLGGDDNYNQRCVSSLNAYLNCGGNQISEKKSKESDFDYTKLYGTAIFPTTLETYFSCPCKAFLQRGLQLSERQESTLGPLEAGNFIHTVLEQVAGRLKDNLISDEDDCAAQTKEIAKELITDSRYAVQSDDESGKYSAQALTEEAVEVALGMYAQISNSRFTVRGVETPCKLQLDGVTVGGRADRVDECGDMVRIIDYKTGSIDDDPKLYYMGIKLQLPLYLLSASEGKRAVGAYYFPANRDFSENGVGGYTLKGYMDASEEVVKSSDVNVTQGQRSAYVGAYLNGRKIKNSMPKEDFADFIDYAGMIAKKGAEELMAGNIAPSPAHNACEYCKFAGCCGYDVEKSGERAEEKAKCEDVARIVREEKGKGGDGR